MPFSFSLRASSPLPAGRRQKGDRMPYPVFRHHAVDHSAGEENGEHAHHLQRLFTGLKSAVSAGHCGNQRALIHARNKSISLSIAYLP
jgi:hypothetical protein